MQWKNGKARKLDVDKWAQVFVCNMYINSIYFDEMPSRTINFNVYFNRVLHIYTLYVHRQWTFLYTILLGANIPCYCKLSVSFSCFFLPCFVKASQAQVE